MPEMALRLLAHRYTPPTFGDRVRRAFHNPPSDDELRDNRLRFQALLQQGAAWNKELQALYDQLCRWAPRLLDGEVLVNFYLDGLLRPLLAVGRIDLVWRLLPQVRDALSASSGDKHAMQVQRVATLLAKEAAAHFSPAGQAAGVTPAPVLDGHESSGHAAEGNAERHAPDVDPFEAHAALGRFMVELWQADLQKGLWQTIHGVEGTLPLLLALEGPDALVVLAQTVAKEGSQWTQ
ncbi:MAG TPA: hypothetical protein VNK95_07170, partial [Caldilineaceae bacterium]|nr:hypothetical protein [Caldilineaceae bacterium]